MLLNFLYRLCRTMRYLLLLGLMLLVIAFSGCGVTFDIAVRKTDGFTATVVYPYTPVSTTTTSTVSQ